MYREIEKWLDGVLKNAEIPKETRAFNFNLYEDGDSNWSVEIVATASFDRDDEDWACDETDNFGTRDNPFCWQEETEWSAVLSKMQSVLTEYLENGRYAGVLKEYTGVGVGFVDGDIEILYAE